MAAAAVVLGGCGTGGTEATANTVSGLAVADAPVQGTVSVKDASAAAWSKPTATGTDGSFSVDVSGLTPPFLLKVEWTDGSGARRMYSAAAHAGHVDITPVTDAAVAGSRDDDGEGDDDHVRAPPSGSFESVVSQLRTALAPLLERYGVTSFSDGAALRALLADVRFAVSSGTLTVTNRATGGVIFSGPLRNLASGTFHPENMPAGPGTTPPPPPPPPAACTYTYSPWSACANGTQTRTVLSSSPAGCTGTPVLSQACTVTPPPPPAIDGAALYTQSCAGCHGPLASSSKRGATASQIQAAIAANRGGMGSLSGLSAAQIDAIAAALR